MCGVLLQSVKVYYSQLVNTVYFDIYFSKF